MKNKNMTLLIRILILAFLIAALIPAQVMAARNLNGTLTGVVLNDKGKAVPNTTVYIYKELLTNTDGFAPSYVWCQLVTSTKTNKSGTYKVSVPAGEYRVWFVPQNLDSYSMEAYPDAAYIANGLTVRVGAGQTTSRISVTLDPSSSISGYVKTINRDLQLTDIANIPVALCVQDVSLINCLSFTHTGTDGSFSFHGLKEYPWQLWVNIGMISEPGGAPAEDPYFNPEYKNFQLYAFGKYSWLPQPGTTIPIDVDYDDDPQTLADTIYLESNDFINLEGVVEDQQSHDPIEGLNIRVQCSYYSPEGDLRWEDYEGDPIFTDANGHFEVTGLANYKGYVTLSTDGSREGSTQYFGEYCDTWGGDDMDQGGAQMFEIKMGQKTNITSPGNLENNWQLMPMF